MSGSVHPCDKCDQYEWTVLINDKGLCTKCAKVQA